jgi:hypothetical protein
VLEVVFAALTLIAHWWKNIHDTNRYSEPAICRIMSQILICETSKLCGMCKYNFYCMSIYTIKINEIQIQGTEQLHWIVCRVWWHTFLLEACVTVFLCGWPLQEWCKHIIYLPIFINSVIKYYNVCDSEKPVTQVKPETVSAIWRWCTIHML